MSNQPSPAFVFAAWFALIAGSLAFLVGLWNAELQLNEQGFFFTVLTFGLFAAVTVQKCVRDRAEGILVTDIYYGISWSCAVLAVILFCVGVWNSELLLSEKGIYVMAFLLALFGAITVQKNTRDLQQFAAPKQIAKNAVF
jgi:uncharacterized membrane protein YiaA